MTPNLLDQILEGVYTQTDSLRRLRLLKDQLITKIFGGATVRVDPRVNPNLPDSGLSDEDQDWLKKIMANVTPGVNKNNLYQVFNDLETTIKQTDALSVFIPFEMPKDEIIKLGTTLKQTYGKNFLMELKFDPKLVAGAALSWKGVYKDYSLHQRVLDNQAQILQTLKKYIKHGQ